MKQQYFFCELFRPYATNMVQHLVNNHSLVTKPYVVQADDETGDGDGDDLAPVDSKGQFWSSPPGLIGEWEYLVIFVRRDMLLYL